MQHMHTHEAVTECVEAKKLLTRRRQTIGNLILGHKTFELQNVHPERHSENFVLPL